MGGGRGVSGATVVSGCFMKFINWSDRGRHDWNYIYKLLYNYRQNDMKDHNLAPHMALMAQSLEAPTPHLSRCLVRNVTGSSPYISPLALTFYCMNYLSYVVLISSSHWTQFAKSKSMKFGNERDEIRE